MTLHDFLRNPVIPAEPGAYVIRAAHFPVAFVERLRHGLSALSLPVISLDLTERGIGATLMALNTSFLGGSSVYVVTGCDTTNAEHEQFCRELLSYRGPHTAVCVAVGALELEHERFITIPDVVDRVLYEALESYLYTDTGDPKFVVNLYHMVRVLSFDSAVICMWYQRLLGRRHEQFFSEWLSLLQSPEYSLFMLSAAFFAKQKDEFARLWIVLRDQYPPEFWLAFWSDQLCNALVFIAHASRDIVAAKKYAKRIPFSFMSRDWKRVKGEHLVMLHDQLATLDTELKSGGSQHCLDVWYATWLMARVMA